MKGTRKKESEKSVRKIIEKVIRKKRIEKRIEKESRSLENQKIKITTKRIEDRRALMTM